MLKIFKNNYIYMYTSISIQRWLTQISGLVLKQNLAFTNNQPLQVAKFSSVLASKKIPNNKSSILFGPHAIFWSKHLHIMKPDTEEFKSLFESIFTPELNQLIDLFKKYDHEIRLAGGPVRDLLMGIKPKDLDFATTATPDEMKEMFTVENIRMINLTGEKHGTITARINEKENFEITTLRIDVVNKGRHAEVEFTKNWELDANRRDLTINSMFLGFDGTVYDYCGGWEDVKKRRVAFVGNAETRIQEDYLRILRYFRFCARISPDPLMHEREAEEAICKNVDGLSIISGERIWMELKQILSSRHAFPLMEVMIKWGLAPYIGLPQKDSKELLNTPEFREVWQRTRDQHLEAISILATLLKTEDEALSLRKKLKYPNFDHDLALFIIQHRDLMPDPLKPLRPYQMIVIDYKNKLKDAKMWGAELLRYQGKCELAEELLKWNIPRFPVSGDTLKKEGVPGGKSMNLVIQRLRNKWKEMDFLATEEELIRFIPNILEDLQIGFKK